MWRVEQKKRVGGRQPLSDAFERSATGDTCGIPPLPQILSCSGGETVQLSLIQAVNKATVLRAWALVAAFAAVGPNAQLLSME